MPEPLNHLWLETPYLMGEQLGIEELIRETEWEDLKEWGKVKAGVKVRKADPIFPRIDLEEYFEKVEKRKEKEMAIEKEDKKEEKELISLEEFSKVDIREARYWKRKG